MTARKPPTLPARDKVAFLLSLVPWLIDNDTVTVTEAAARFGVTPEQVRDSVRLIAVSGIPGDTTSYQHSDLFDIDWDSFELHDEIRITNLVAIDESPRFSGREAAALIVGLQYLSSLPENADTAAIDSLMSKLARGTSGAPSRLAVAAGESDESLATIREAVAQGVQVEFDYRDSRGASARRRVDPLRIESLDADWYLRGWCHLREGVRTFRLDRVSGLVVTDQPIEHRPADIALPETLFEGSASDLLVTIEYETAAAPLIADYLAAGHPSPDAPSAAGLERSEIRVSHYHGLKRLVASMAGVVTVVAPPAARASVAEWAASGAARYTA